MKQLSFHFICVCLLLASLLTGTELKPEDKQEFIPRNSFHTLARPSNVRPARAVGESHHPKSVKALVYDLVKGTVDESQIVYRNISRIFLNSFTTTTTTPGPDDVDIDNSTTTTPQPEFTIRDFYRLVGVNYRGLNRLFLTEFQLALKDSINNVGTFRNDLRLSFFPFLRPDAKYSHHNLTHAASKTAG